MCSVGTFATAGGRLGLYGLAVRSVSRIGLCSVGDRGKLNDSPAEIAMPNESAGEWEKISAITALNTTDYLQLGLQDQPHPFTLKLAQTAHAHRPSRAAN